MDMKEINFEMIDDSDISFSLDKEKQAQKQLEERLKKAPFGGYTKASVEQYAAEVSESMMQIRGNFEQQIRTLSAECSKLSNECDVLRSQIQQAEKKNADTKQNLAIVTLEKSELEQKVQEIQSTASLSDEYRKQILSLQNEMRAKTAQIADYEEQISQLQTKLQNAMTHIEKLNNEISAAQMQVADLEQKQKNHAQGAAVQDELDKLRESYAKLEQQNMQLQQLDKLNTDLQSKLDRLQTELNQSHNDLSQQKMATDALEQKLAQQEQLHIEELKKAEADTITTKDSISAIEQKYSKLYEQYTMSLGRIEQLKVEKSAIKQLLNKYQAKEQEMAVIQEENAELKSAVTELQRISTEILDMMEKQHAVYKTQSALLAEKDKAISDLNSQKIELQMRSVHLMERMEILAKEQKSSTEKQFLSADCSKQQESESDARETFAPHANRSSFVDLDSAQSLLNRAKEIGDSCTA